MPHRVLVTSDTHVPDFAKALPAALLDAATRADLILHAGDVTSTVVLERLSGLAPTRVALGNNDRPEIATWGGEEVVRLELDCISIAMLHDAGPRASRERRLLGRFGDTDLVVFGHSHIPMLTKLGGRRFLNPGSPTWKRRQPAPTYATIVVDGHRARIRIVALP